MVNLLISLYNAGLYSTTSKEKLLVVSFFFFFKVTTQFAGTEVFIALPFIFFLSLVSHRKYLFFHHIHLFKEEVEKIDIYS